MKYTHRSTNEEVAALADSLTKRQRHELLRRYRLAMHTCLIPITMSRGTAVACRNLRKKNLLKGFELTNLGYRVSWVFVNRLLLKELFPLTYDKA